MKNKMLIIIATIFMVFGITRPAQAYPAFINDPGEGIAPGATSVSGLYVVERYLAVFICDYPTCEYIYNVSFEGQITNLPGVWLGSTIVGGPWTGYSWDGKTDGEPLPWYPGGIVAPAGQNLPPGEYSVIYAEFTDPAYTQFYKAAKIAALEVVSPVPTERSIQLMEFSGQKLGGKVVSKSLTCKSSVKVKIFRNGDFLKSVTTKTNGSLPEFRVKSGKYKATLPQNAFCTGAADTLRI